jgi:hypothetical protein
MYRREAWLEADALYALKGGGFDGEVGIVTSARTKFSGGRYCSPAEDDSGCPAIRTGV